MTHSSFREAKHFGLRGNKACFILLIITLVQSRKKTADSVEHPNFRGTLTPWKLSRREPQS